MTTIRRSYALFRESLRVLSADKELLIFPLLSGIFTILAFVTTVFAGTTTGLFDHLGKDNPLGYVVLFVWYFISWFIVLFFNVAVIHCAKIRLDGGDPTVADGFRASTQHLGRIAVWALISATIGIILRVIAERAKFIGALIARLLGAAWAIATYFIVPVMIFERRSLRDSVSQSTSLISKTWGESLVASVGIGVFTMLLAVAGLAIPILGAVISPTAGVIGLGVMVAYWIGLAILTSALSGIFRTALYVFATEGRAPAGFSTEFVQHAFGPKGGATAFPRASSPATR